MTYLGSRKREAKGRQAWSPMLPCNGTVSAKIFIMFWNNILKRNKSHSATEIKNITSLVYSEYVLKVGESGHFSEWPRADMLTSTTDKRMRSSIKLG